MSIIGILLTLGASLLLTELVEVPAALLAGVRGKSAMLLVVLANLATNPVVVYGYILTRMMIGRGTAEAVLAFLEAGAVLLEAWLYAHTPSMMDAETLFYRKLPSSRSGGTAALLLSLLLNAASYLAGEFVNAL